MASIYKRGGKKNRAGTYYVKYFDETGKRETVRGCTDKEATLALARKLEADVLLRKNGIIDAKADRYAAEGRKPIVTADSTNQRMRATGMEGKDQTNEHPISTGAKSVDAYVDTYVDSQATLHVAQDHSMAHNQKAQEECNSEKVRRLGVVCHAMSRKFNEINKLEAAGVEPASENAREGSPTCLVSAKVSPFKAQRRLFEQPAFYGFACRAKAIRRAIPAFMTPLVLSTGKNRTRRATLSSER